RRGAVYSLLGAMAAVIAPHAGRLPAWLMLLVGACLLWQAAATARSWKPLSRWLLALLSIASTVSIIAAFGPLPAREGSVALLALMAGLKCLELHSARDAHVATFLAYFLIVTHFLYAQDALLALYMLGVLAWLLATSIAFQDRNRSMAPRRIVRFAALVLAAAAPVALVLFLLFPRVQGPLFGSSTSMAGGTSGLSGRMTPGDISDLGLSEEVAFRVEFRGSQVKPGELYWRGPTLWDFDGRSWYASAQAGEIAARYEQGSREVAYRMTLEPHRRRWLFALDVPVVIPAEASLTADLQLRAAQPVRQRMRYEMRSHLNYRVGMHEPPRVLQRALRLPEGFNPRTMALAQELRERSTDAGSIVVAALELFRTQPFSYTLAPPPLGRDSVDEFLFDSRRGFCEHYASAFTVLMRAAGVPARVVTGYQGGEQNRLGDYLVVRQSHAHAWTEVWLENRGWVRVDPTTAVAPARVETGSSARWIEEGRHALAPAGALAALFDLRQLLDSMAKSWNEWVLDYSPQRQRNLLRDLGLGHPSWPTLGLLMVGLVAFVIGMVALLNLSDLRPRQHDPVQRAYRRFCAKLARIGCVRQPHEGPIDFAQRVARLHPPLAEPVQHITDVYVRLRYAAPAASTATELRALVRGFEPGS
ncbi:MAG: DUF3488 domain-containing transglutaminase family protein, partial [Burkholderiales bacterium]|nr:DUF3488 domain-containing transglutaminase family protein [Burkholderiales bacterium]